MVTLVLIVHILVSLLLMGVVLLQSGKAGDLASAFGGATSQTAFGARSAATVLTKATAVCAVLFMLTSLTLAVLYTKGEGSVMEQVPYTEPAPEETPSRPESPPQKSPPAQPPSGTPSEGTPPQGD